MATFTSSENGVRVTIEVPDESMEAIANAQATTELGRQHLEGVQMLLDMKVQDVLLTVVTALTIPRLAAAMLVGTAGEYQRLNETLTLLIGVPV